MKKILSLLLVLFILPGPAAARAEEEELVPITINYILDGKVIHKAQRILVSAEAELLPESLRGSFSKEYIAAENNDWRIIEGFANIILLRPGARPQTGDEGRAGLWAAVLAVSGAYGAAAFYYLMQKKRNK